MKMKDLYLNTERLVLRPFKRRDAKHMHKWASDSEVTKYLFWYTHTKIKQTRDFIKLIMKNKNPYDWMIVLKDTNTPVGSLGAVKIDIEKRSCEVGYCLAKEQWNKGIMTEALSAVLTFLSNKEGFNEINATHNIHNPGSGRVMEKSGMKYIETKEIYNKIKDETVMAHWYSIKK